MASDILAGVTTYSFWRRSSYDSGLRLGTSLVSLRCILSSFKQSDLYLGDQIIFPYIPDVVSPLL